MGTAHANTHIIIYSAGPMISSKLDIQPLGLCTPVRTCVAPSQPWSPEYTD